MPARRGRDRAASLAELRRRAGGHLDPDLVAVFAADPDACGAYWTNRTC
ncbi:hypothetical protein ACFV4K_12845 [Nocardia sp. NPDC059764]